MSSRPTVLVRSTRLVAGVMLGAVLAGVMPASAAPGANGDQVNAARQAVEAARATRVEAESRLATLVREREQFQRRLDSSSSEVNAIAEQVAAARREARERAVDAYIAGGDGLAVAALLETDRLEDASARGLILVDQTRTAADAAEAFERLRQDNDPEVVALALALDDVDRRIEIARSDLAQASAQEADAERNLMATSKAAGDAIVAAARAQAERDAADRVAAQRATAERTRRSAAASTSGDPDAARWAKLVKCESGGDYTIVSPSGRYRGAYQFDQRTWESVGGTGDPAAATPAEQDLRARILYERRGARAWPHCGIHLRG